MVYPALLHRVSAHFGDCGRDFDVGAGDESLVVEFSALHCIWSVVGRWEVGVRELEFLGVLLNLAGGVFWRLRRNEGVLCSEAWDAMGALRRWNSASVFPGMGIAGTELW